jgi:hypothetical protein
MKVIEIREITDGHWGIDGRVMSPAQLRNEIGMSDATEVRVYTLTLPEGEYHWFTRDAWMEATRVTTMRRHPRDITQQGV